MASSNRNIVQKCKIFLPSLLLLLVTSALGQLDIPTELQFRICEAEPINKGSALERNLNVVLSSLVQNVGKTGYNISWHGENGDKVYGLAQCRGDLNASACQLCVSNATKTLSSECKGFSFAIIMLNGCFVRYDTSDFYSQFNLSDTLSQLDISCDNTKINDTDAKQK